MTADQLWPDDASLDAAHDAAAAKIGGLFKGDLGVQVAHEIADAVLAALSVHAVPRAVVVKKLSDWEHRLPERFVRELRDLAGGDQ